MELYKGLPLRTVEAINLEDVDCIFGVTTEAVNELITRYFDSALREKDDEVEYFDSAYMYAVPQNIFENTNDEELIMYINKNIDNNYKL